MSWLSLSVHTVAPQLYAALGEPDFVGDYRPYPDGDGFGSPGGVSVRLLPYGGVTVLSYSWDYLLGARAAAEGDHGTGVLRGGTGSIPGSPLE